MVLVMARPKYLSCVTPATVGAFFNAFHQTYNLVQFDGSSLRRCALDQPCIRAAVEAMLDGKMTPGRIERVLETRRIRDQWNVAVPGWCVTEMTMGWLVIHPTHETLPLQKGSDRLIPFLCFDTPVRTRAPEIQ
jgi:hypothetical protein